MDRIKCKASTQITMEDDINITDSRPDVYQLIEEDVYKRQGMDVPVTIDDWTKMLAAMKANGVEYPVSYTHLDVYKRQVQDTGDGPALYFFQRG